MAKDKPALKPNFAITEKDLRDGWRKNERGNFTRNIYGVPATIFMQADEWKWAWVTFSQDYYDSPKSAVESLIEHVQAVKRAEGYGAIEVLQDEASILEHYSIHYGKEFKN